MIAQLLDRRGDRPSGDTSRPWSAVLRWSLRVLLALVLLALVVVGVTAFRVWHVARQDERPHSDAIIVLGASQFDGHPSEIFAARLDHAKTLYDEHVAAHIVTVGGKQPGDRFTEAGAGADYLRRHGVPSSALLPVGVGNDTFSSLQGARQVFGKHRWHSAVLVTDPWHSLRSRTIASDLGLSAHTSPVRRGPAVQGRGTELHYIARETVAYLAYEIFGGESKRGPRAV